MTRWILSATFAFLCMAAFGAPLQKAASGGVSNPLHMTVLGGALSQSISSLPLGDHAALAKALFPATRPDVLPAAFSPEKAALLLRAAIAADGAAVAAAAQQQPRVKAARLLLAVNSVLQHVSAQRLETLSNEQLQGIAAAIMDQAAPARLSGAGDSLSGLAALSHVRSEQLLSPGNRRVKRAALQEASPWSPALTGVSGMPSSARGLETEPGIEVELGGQSVAMRPTVFRHYVADDDDLRRMQPDASGFGHLFNAISSYVRDKRTWFGTSAADVYKDLTGVFLTLPGVDPAAVGVPGRKAYLDVRIPADFPIFELEKGRIFLVPLPAQFERDAAADFRKNADQGLQPPIPGEFQETLKLFNEDMIPGPALRLPVQVVGSARSDSYHAAFSYEEKGVSLEFEEADNTTDLHRSLRGLKLSYDPVAVGRFSDLRRVLGDRAVKEWPVNRYIDGGDGALVIMEHQPGVKGAVHIAIDKRSGRLSFYRSQDGPRGALRELVDRLFQLPRRGRWSRAWTTPTDLR
ncbi:MAG: hypothetical protein AAB036_03690 [Elusimicrobiota bacterium]